MASKKNRARASKDAAPRKYKKKTSQLVIDKVAYVDYKDVDLLSRFMSDRAKIRNRRVSGNDVQQQRDVANAIKVAREMALLPYAKRVANQRTTRPPRDGRGPRSDDAPTLATSPGPGAAADAATNTGTGTPDAATDTDTDTDGEG